MKLTPELIERYFASEFQERATKTVENHRYYLGLFVQFVGRRPLGAEVYGAWQKHCFATWAPLTAKNLALASTKRFLNWLERLDLIGKAPHRMVKAPLVRSGAVRAPFTRSECDRLTRAAVELEDTPMHWAIVCGWATGMAIGDVALLKWANVDFSENVIFMHRQKTHEFCTIPLSAGECLTMLHEKFQQRSTAWPNKPEEGVFYVDTDLAAAYLAGGAVLQRRFARIRARAGVGSDKSFHNLRAAFCSALANGGMSTAMACQATGHKDPAIFKHYVTPDVARLRDQIERARQIQG